MKKTIYKTSVIERVTEVDIFQKIEVDIDSKKEFLDNYKEEMSKFDDSESVVDLVKKKESDINYYIEELNKEYQFSLMSDGSLIFNSLDYKFLEIFLKNGENSLWIPSRKIEDVEDLLPDFKYTGTEVLTKSETYQD
jgi:hypothetical protein